MTGHPAPESVPSCRDTTALRRQVIDVCRAMVAQQFFIGTWGNISVRVKPGLLITPSRLDYFVMRPGDLVIVTPDRRRIGRRLLSSETALHQAILNARPDIGALIHHHVPHTSSLACAGAALPVCVEDMAQIIGGEVRCAKYVPGGRHQTLAEAAVKAIGKKAMAVLLRNHGTVVGGRTLEEAMVAVQVLEKAAQVWLQARLTGKPTAIPARFVVEERFRYLYKYGKESDAAIHE